MTPDNITCRDLYLDLLKNTLTGLVYDDDEVKGRRVLVRVTKSERAKRVTGQDWPLRAQTMVGRVRLDNVQQCIEQVIAQHVPGDLIETGVWRGGVTIFMRAVLKAHGVTDRTVWVADSFQGLPPPRPSFYPSDRGLNLSGIKYLAVSLPQVQANFERYGLLDAQVRFLPGWFRDTLPSAPIDRLAVLRLDGDLYESTMDALTHLYPRLSPGGFAIIDDYGHIEACRQAVHDYRDAQGVTEPIVPVDQTGVYWQRRR